MTLKSFSLSIQYNEQFSLFSSYYIRSRDDPQKMSALQVTINPFYELSNVCIVFQMLGWGAGADIFSGSS